ncbi:MAG TPA: hypothetical protein VGA03_03670 [Anaerolineales bacterium]
MILRLVPQITRLVLLDPAPRVVRVMPTDEFACAFLKDLVSH